MRPHPSCAPRRSRAPGSAPHSVDEFGKTYFPNPDFDTANASALYYTGTVTPALHYCMGGIEIDDRARVLASHGAGTPARPIPGLFAAGEVVGGIHGNNRLAGNALTECVVFGRIAAEAIREEVGSSGGGGGGGAAGAVGPTVAAPVGGHTPQLRTVTVEELAQHDGREGRRVWVAMYGRVYDLTDFVDEHPGGPESITRVAGTDGTEAFANVHTESMLEDFQPIGVLASV